MLVHSPAAFQPNVMKEKSSWSPIEASSAGFSLSQKPRTSLAVLAWQKPKGEHLVRVWLSLNLRIFLALSYDKRG